MCVAWRLLGSAGQLSGHFDIDHCRPNITRNISLGKQGKVQSKDYKTRLHILDWDDKKWESAENIVQ